MLLLPGRRHVGAHPQSRLVLRLRAPGRL